MNKIETISIDKQVSYVLTLQMIFLFIIGGAIFSGVTGVNDLSTNSWIVIGAYIGTIILHELLHGVGFIIADAKPRFGVGIAGAMPIAYATSDKPIKIHQMLLVAYLPFVTLSVFFVLLAVVRPQYQDIALIGFLGNFTGAVGDLWISSKLWKYIKIKDLLVKDTKSGIEIYSSDKKAIQIASRSKNKEISRLIFGKQWAIASLIMFGVQILTPIILSIVGFKENIKLGFGELYLFETTTSIAGETATVSFNLFAPVVIGLLFIIILRTIQKFKHIS